MHQFLIELNFLIMDKKNETLKKLLKFVVVEAPVPAVCNDSYLQYGIIAASCCCDGCSGDLVNGAGC